METETSTLPAPTAGPRRGLFKTWAQVLLHPASFFDSIRDERRFGPPLRFAYAMAAVAWVVSAARVLTGTAPLGKHSATELILFTAAKLAQLPLEVGFIGGFLLLKLGRWVGGAEGSYRQAFGVCCYSLAVLSVGGLPGALFPAVGTATGLTLMAYGVYIAATGVVVLQRSKRIPTFVAFGLLALGLAALGHYALEHRRAGTETTQTSG